MQKKVIIIGAGLAGLAAGCYAQMNGYSSEIYEHFAIPGGLAATWVKNGFLITTSIQALAGYNNESPFYKLYSELGIIKYNKFIPTEKGHLHIDEINDKRIEITSDLNKWINDFKNAYPEDADMTDTILNGAKNLSEIDIKELLIQKSKGENSAINRFIKILNIPQGGKDIKFLKTSLSEFAKNFRNPVLRKSFMVLVNPSGSVFAFLNSMGLFKDIKLGLIEGGVYELVDSIEKRYRKLGGKITPQSQVSKILVKNNKVTGIRLAAGTVVECDNVISAGDGRNTIYNLLEGKYMSKNIKKMYETWTVCRPCIIFNYGIKKEYPDAFYNNLIFLKHPINAGISEIKNINLRIYNYSQKFSPKGSTLFQARVETDWDYWTNLKIIDPNLYNSELERICREILASINKHFPGTASNVELTDIMPSFTLWERTLNYKGSPMGWYYTGDPEVPFIEKKIPGLDGFYMAGHWVTSGGQALSTLYSGKEAVELLCRDDKKDFITSLP